MISSNCWRSSSSATALTDPRPQVVVDVSTQAAEVVQELAQPMLGMLGGEMIGGDVAD